MVLLKRAFYRYLMHLARQTSPEDLEELSAKRALQVFRKAAKTLPFYDQILKEANVEPQDIHTIDDFKKNVPLLNKALLYSLDKDKLKIILQQADIPLIQSILLSSGSTGMFSFGLTTPQENQKSGQFLNILLDHYFHILTEKTLIINCLQSAVRLPTSLSAVVVECGPRSDSLNFLIRRLSWKFSQTIVIGDHYFLKNALEDGVSQGLDFKQWKIHLIVGGDFITENLRTYLAHLLHTHYPDGHIFSSMGISEFGINLFIETPEMVKLRKLVKSTPQLQERFIDPSYPHYIPMFFNYFPQSIFVEEIHQQIVLTNLSLLSRLPLIRYNSEDKGRIISYSHLEKILKEFSLQHLLPPFKSPLVMMYGKDRYISTRNVKIYPNQIQRGLYSDFDVASKTTGYFRLRLDKEDPVLEIQLKKGLVADENLKAQFNKAIRSYTPTDIHVIFYPYQNFPYGMELDYERKFKFI